MAICDHCQYNVCDEESGEFFCTMDLDEDELARFMQGSESECGYFKAYDEYKLVEKQN